MSAKSGEFRDEFDDLFEQAGLSNEDLERVMAGMEGSDGGLEALEEIESGRQLRGVVVDVRGGEVLVELDGKNLGVIDEAEFAEEELPRGGDEIRAEFIRYDKVKNAAILSVKGVRREVAWDNLRVGALLEGTVTETNKGGLTLDIKGFRAFMPVSQVALERVDDLEPYVGRKLRCEVTSFDRGSENLVVSRRVVLEREAEDERGTILSRLSEGDVLSGTVVRVTDHGAFVDLGGVDGLLHASKIHRRLKSEGDEKALRVGQKVQVEVIRIDRERQRVSLDFKQMEADAWGRAGDDYKVGDQVTGWVSSTSNEGVILSIEDGIQGLLPVEHLRLLEQEPLPGALVTAVITDVDSVQRRITLKPA